ncbi:MAG: Ig-like domain-containing protein [Bryobacterales bacterium]|nr:Ig-like domain-containing protein [Bryobacterales bacterium]
MSNFGLAATTNAAPCTVTVSPAHVSAGASGIPATSIAVTGPASCAWTARSNRSWIQVQTAEGGTPGALRFAVQANPGTMPRVGVVEVGQSVVQVIQSGTTAATAFSDVPASHLFSDYIALMPLYAVSNGCEGTRYCSEAWTTRADMAQLIIRSLLGESFSYAPQPYFQDVPSTHPQFKYIQKMKELQITDGCSTVPNYCPSGLITRGQMSVFIVRAAMGNTFTTSAQRYFDDVPEGHIFFRFIQRMREMGITGGCTETAYCVNSLVSNGQMAAFLARGKALIGVSVTPASAALQAGQTVQLNAAVSGTANKEVVWSLNPQIGSISATGLYQAPAVTYVAQTVEVTARSKMDPFNPATVSLRINPPVQSQPPVTSVSVSVTPVSASVIAGETKQFTAAVTGSSNTAVTWRVMPAVGTVSASGLYTAPASVTAAQPVTIMATLVADSSKSGGVVLTVNPAPVVPAPAPAPVVSVTVSPTSASVTAGQTRQFAATVTGASNTAVTWSVMPALGSVSATGLYTAPANLVSAQTVTVRATSVADGTKSAGATVTVNPPAPVVSVSVTPATASVEAGQTRQFAATVTGASNTAVTWSVMPAVGSVSAAGLYTAPANLVSAQTVTVRATSVADGTKSAGASVTVNPPAPVVSVTVTPTTASVEAGQTRQFAATVTGASNTAVTWSVMPALGSVSASGLYTAPGNVVSAQTVTVKATSAADPSKSAAAMVSITPVLPAVSVTVTPGSATVQAGQTQALTATVSGASNTAVTWSLSPAVGSLATNGLTAVYAAPGVVSQAQTVEVQATSVADPSKGAKVLLSLVPLVTVTLAPTSVTLEPGQSRQFTATVAGTSNTAVTWSVQPAVGTITSSGLYTAPATVAADQTVEIRATSGSTASNVAAVGLKKPDAGSTVTFTTGPNGLQTLMVDGVNRNYVYGEGLLSYVWYKDAQGKEVQAAPSCQKSFTADTVTHDCVAAGFPIRLVARYSTPRSDTVSASIQVTNTGHGAFTKLMISTLGLQFPQFDYSKSKVQDVGMGNPVGWGNFVTGRWAIWLDTILADTTVGPFCGWSTVCKNHLYIGGLSPRENKVRQYSLRFSTEFAQSALQWVPEAYQCYQDINPAVIQWPDRRPIMEWFIAEGTKRSALNPRGYFQDALLDALNPSIFRQRAIASAQRVVDLMNARPVRPQGVIVWDLEGQEFNHATTYIGDPRVFSSGYAPEMNAVVDDMFKLIRDAGYRIGVTVRPQYLDWGSVLPSTCRYHSSNEFKQYFIKVNGWFGEKFFACYDSAGLQWSLIPNSNGNQTYYNRDNNAVLSLLRSKIQYARQRWGATLFYVDSAVWVAGAPLDAEIFKTLQRDFPDILMIPEQETLDHLAATMPFTDPRNGGDAKFSPVTWRWVYPQGAMGIHIGDCRGSCWDGSQWHFNAGIKVGDIAMYAQPQQMYGPHLTAIENAIQQAQRENSVVNVTNQVTGRTHSFNGSPATTHTYPVKMRVYFARSAGELASSTLFCEAGQWLGENSCTLNLQGMTVLQVQYYDFTNRYVKSEAATPFAP